MSKHHAASRRRSYGRRQHELHERIDRIREVRRGEREWRAAHAQVLDPVDHVDMPAQALRFGFSD